jgi:hypothetical protein
MQQKSLPKSKLVFSFIAGGVTALLLCTALGVRPSSPAQAQTGGARWEYMYLSGEDPTQPPTVEKLNQAGKKGWEAACGFAGFTVLLKRRL